MASRTFDALKAILKSQDVVHAFEHWDEVAADFTAERLAMLLREIDENREEIPAYIDLPHLGGGPLHYIPGLISLLYEHAPGPVMLALIEGLTRADVRDYCLDSIHMIIAENLLTSESAAALKPVFNELRLSDFKSDYYTLLGFTNIALEMKSSTLAHHVVNSIETLPEPKRHLLTLFLREAGMIDDQLRVLVPPQIPAPHELQEVRDEMARLMKVQ